MPSRERGDEAGNQKIMSDASMPHCARCGQDQFDCLCDGEPDIDQPLLTIQCPRCRIPVFPDITFFPEITVGVHPDRGRYVGLHCPKCKKWIKWAGADEKQKLGIG